MLTFKEYFMLQEAPAIAEPVRDRTRFPNQVARRNNRELRNPPPIENPLATPKEPGPERLANRMANNRDMIDPDIDKQPPVDAAPAPVDAAPTTGDREIDSILAIDDEIERKRQFMQYYQNVNAELQKKGDENDKIENQARQDSNKLGGFGAPIGVPDTDGFSKLLKKRTDAIKTGIKYGLLGDSKVITLEDGNLILAG